MRKTPHMKRWPWLALGGLAYASIAMADEGPKYHAGSLFDGCTQAFYDPDMYNWYSYKNLCNETTKITFGGRATGLTQGAMTLQPGRKDSTGQSRSEVESKGGLEAAICRAGYIPVDAKTTTGGPGRRTAVGTSVTDTIARADADAVVPCARLVLFRRTVVERELEQGVSCFETAAASDVGT